MTDPTTWEADFVEAVSAALGRRLAPVLVGLNAVQLAAQDELAHIVGSSSEDRMMHEIFTETVRFKAPGGFLEALSATARREHMTASEFLRRAAIERMEECGTHLGSSAPAPGTAAG